MEKFRSDHTRDPPEATAHHDGIRHATCADAMKRVVIIGGGFGGLACARALRQCPSAEVVLLDRKPTSDFLPVLPDIVGGLISPGSACVSLSSCAKRDGFRFIQDDVMHIDMERRLICGQGGQREYDYLIIAAGTQTNFYGSAEAARASFKLDSVSDAGRISAAIAESSFDTAVVAGGGYTGIEIATNLRRRLARLNRNKKIIVAEASGSILNTLPEWIPLYVQKNLSRMDVEVRVNCRVESITNNRIVLSSGQVCEPAILIWAAGVQTPPFVRDVPLAKTRQGRLVVDDFLRVSERVFSVGDTAAFAGFGQPLRMAVQFAVAQGTLTGENVRRALRGEALHPYRPRDLGYIVPMANRRACGVVLNHNVRGFPAILLHYAMCVRRSTGINRKARILRDLL